MVSPDWDVLWNKYYHDWVDDLLETNPYTIDVKRRLNNKIQKDFSIAVGGKQGRNMAKGPAKGIRIGKFDPQIISLQIEKWQDKWETTKLLGQPNWPELSPTQAQKVVEGKLTAARYFI